MNECMSVWYCTSSLSNNLGKARVPISMFTDGGKSAKFNKVVVDCKEKMPRGTHKHLTKATNTRGLECERECDEKLEWGIYGVYI